MDDPRIGQQLGAWRLDKLIGSGGMSDVYMAHRVDGVVDQTVAVKVVRSVPLHGLRDEATTLYSLERPNIAQCFGSGLTPDGRRYIVIEFVDGEPITEYADQRGLSIHDRLDLFLKACDAIEFSHEHFVVHMDIKPENILVSGEGSVKVIDFGIARSVSGSEDEEQPVPASGPYASPEQIQSQSRLGYPADIYALGAVLYELLCGHPPFNPRLVAAELERQILEEGPPAPSSALYQAKLAQSDSGQYFRLEPDAIARMRGGCRLAEARKLIGGDLDRICLFALRKEPARRYGSVDDLRSDLQEVLAGRRPAIARSGDPVYSVLRAVRRRPLAVVGPMLAITMLLTSLTLSEQFSAGTSGSIEIRREYEQVTKSTLEALRDELRPRLLADPRLSASLATLDIVDRTASSDRTKRTVWDDLLEGSTLQLRRVIGTIPRGAVHKMP